MKGRRERSAPLPADALGAGWTAISIHRPLLLLGNPRSIACSSLDDGAAIYPHAMSNEIGEITEAVFGRRVCRARVPSRHRELDREGDPGARGHIPSMLGHADYRTSESYYIFADEHAAFVRLDETLTNLMRDEGRDDIED